MWWALPRPGTSGAGESVSHCFWCRPRPHGSERLSRWAQAALPQGVSFLPLASGFVPQGEAGEYSLGIWPVCQGFMSWQVLGWESSFWSGHLNVQTKALLGPGPVPACCLGPGLLAQRVKAAHVSTACSHAPLEGIDVLDVQPDSPALGHLGPQRANLWCVVKFESSAGA